MLLDRWFEDELEPLLMRHRELAEASLQRKVAHLRESVVAVLQTMLERQDANRSAHDSPADLNQVRTLLQDADEAIRRAEGFAGDVLLDDNVPTAMIIRQAATAVASHDLGQLTPTMIR